MTIDLQTQTSIHTLNSHRRPTPKDARFLQVLNYPKLHICGGLRPLLPTPKKEPRRSPRGLHEDRTLKKELSLVTPVRGIAGKAPLASA